MRLPLASAGIRPIQTRIAVWFLSYFVMIKQTLTQQTSNQSPRRAADAVGSLDDDANKATMANQVIRPVDQLVLELLRTEPGLNVGELTERLEVTATAVRQRLDRLEVMRLVQRNKRATLRGRPVYEYALTALGLRRVGVNYMDFAIAVWEVVQDFPDESFRHKLVDAVSRKMGETYASLLPKGSTAERMDAMAKLLTERKVPARLAGGLNLPILEVQACPYPDLMQEDELRLICELEQQMLSEAIGEPMELACCRLDGYSSCQYRAVSES